jgi:hypothetical protein
LKRSWRRGSSRPRTGCFLPRSHAANRLPPTSAINLAANFRDLGTTQPSGFLTPSRDASKAMPCPLSIDSLHATATLETGFSPSNRVRLAVLAQTREAKD